MVESVVNRVGVDVNTASPALLTYVAGIGPKLAERIVAYRDANGPFRNRAAFRKVAGLGPKAFEQAAGFLRIRGRRRSARRQRDPSRKLCYRRERSCVPPAWTSRGRPQSAAGARRLLKRRNRARWRRN